MADPFIGEVRVFSFDFAPKNWAYCDGALLQISQFQALFSLLGTAYGGDGVTRFGLPNLQGRVAAGFSANYPMGAAAGEVSHTVTGGEMPVTHTHLAMGDTSPATVNPPVGKVFANTTGGNTYATPTAPVSISSGTIAPAGGLPHDNMSPYQVVSFCIALYGIYPPRP